MHNQGLNNLVKRGIIKQVLNRTVIVIPIKSLRWKGIDNISVKVCIWVTKVVSRKSYSTIASSAFDYIEKKLGKEGVMDLLGERQAQLFLQYNQVLIV